MMVPIVLAVVWMGVGITSPPPTPHHDTMTPTTSRRSIASRALTKHPIQYDIQRIIVRETETIHPVPKWKLRKKWNVEWVIKTTTDD